MKIHDIAAKIRRREGPVYSALYTVGKKASTLELPIPKSVLEPLYQLRSATQETGRHLRRLIIYQPLMRSYCFSCGKNLKVDVGIPYIYGNLKITLGDDCHLNGFGALSAGKVFDDPTLEIGDRSYIGYGVTINIAQKVTIGKDVLIADGCIVSDNPGHPVDADLRAAGRPVDAEQVAPVVIHDKVWLGARAIVMPGVTIGEGSVIGTGAIVTKSIEPFSLAVGNPARVVKKLN